MLKWLLVLLIILGFSCLIDIPNKPAPRLSLPIHKTLYIDRNIDDQELNYITEAAQQWQQATQGQVSFEVIRLPQQHINPSNSVFVVNVSPDYPEIIILDTMSQIRTLGFYNNDRLPTIGLVDQRIDEDQFTPVVAHELAHFLGLVHQLGPRGVGTLMSPDLDLGSDHITKFDMIQFCQIYACQIGKVKREIIHGTKELKVSKDFSSTL